MIGINPSEAQIVTTVRRTKLGTMLPSGLDDGTTDASAYFRCVAILAVRLRPLKTHPKFLAGVASLGETLAPKKQLQLSECGVENLAAVAIHEVEAERGGPLAEPA